ncbi:hypothetical protein AB1Y20_007838 [Prymnesium parvum]|uniref:Uncharacterized protein n=1 Tax=Prymnesium parvum TaxID=97485 RepID=A0AB34IV32_PRYPA
MALRPHRRLPAPLLLHRLATAATPPRHPRWQHRAPPSRALHPSPLEGSHPKPLRAAHLASPLPSPPPPGVGWLDEGLTRSVVGTPRGPRLHPSLHGLDLRDWLLVDVSTYGAQMSAKFSALRLRRAEVLQAEDATTLEAQREVAALLLAHLPARYPSHFEARGEARLHVAVGGFGGEVDVAAYASPLEGAARLVQEDLVLMRRGGGGAEDEYHAAAAAVAFSFADLPRRVQQRQSMAALHAKVGGYEADLHRPVSRALHALKVGSPMWRTNWAFSFSGAIEPHPDRYLLNLQKRARLFPDAPVTEWDGADGAVRRIDARGAGDVLFLKTEYQTLRRLPRNSDFVLFTVRTHLTPLRSLEAFPAAAARLAENVRGALQLDFRFYKGLDDPRVAERVLSYLDACSQGSHEPASS